MVVATLMTFLIVTNPPKVIGRQTQKMSQHLASPNTVRFGVWAPKDTEPLFGSTCQSPLDGYMTIWKVRVAVSVATTITSFFFYPGRLAVYRPYEVILTKNK